MAPDFSFVLVFFVVLFVCVTVVILAFVIAKAVKDSRERALWHEERMAMIEAGIHPDYPPDEAPIGQMVDDMTPTHSYAER